jgi:hypothetical protein
LSSRIAFPSAGGDLYVEFGVNRWVLVETPDGQSVQRQVRQERELGALLREVGMTEADTRTAAANAWKERPEDAGSSAARPGESLRRSTGLPQWRLAAVILAFIAVWVIVVLIIVTR